MTKKTLYFILISLLIFILSGCSVGPDYNRPMTRMPAAWQNLIPQTDPNTAAMVKWWTAFNDSSLNTLIENALDNNLTLEQSFLAISRARALRDYTAGRYYPEIDIKGSYRRLRDSANTYFAVPGLAIEPYDSHSIGFDSTWEIDLFGRIKRALESSQANLEASVFDFYNTRVSVISEVARNYIELRTIQARLNFAARNIKSQKETLKLTIDRFEAGLVPELDVSQAKQNLANTQSQLPPLRIAKLQIKNRLAVLLGTYPDKIEKLIDTRGKIPAVPEKIITAIPAELLRRRPDIRRAERLLAAQTAKIGVAQADLYPRLSISGAFSFDADQLREVGLWTSRSYSFGPSVRWNIFDADRLKNLVKVEKISSRQQMLQYNKTVLTAVEEVENAMAAFKLETVRRRDLLKSTKAAQKSVKLVRSLYKSGLTDFQNVLDTQRTLFHQQDALAASTGQVVIDLIALYKAMGGGWSDIHDEITMKNTSQNDITHQ